MAAISRDFIGQGVGGKGIQADPARAVHEIGDAVNVEMLVVVILAGDDGGSAPLLERPLHGRIRTGGSGGIGRVVKVYDLPLGRRLR